ncbi:MAG: hypothetical protein AB8G16_03810 [Gammaproteobacteria bacterium]
MFDSSATRNLAFVSRRLAGLLEDHGLEEALGKISDVTPAHYDVDIERLRALLSGAAPAPPSIGLSPLRTLFKLLPAESGKRGAFFASFVDYIEHNRGLFRTYWAGISSLFWYLFGVAIFALVVMTQYNLFVLPQFRALFNGMGQNLPTLTLWVFQASRPISILFALVLVFCVLPLLVMFVTMYRRIQKLEPMPSMPTWVPFVGRLTRTYNQGLFMNFARILREADVPPNQAVREAANAANLHQSLTPDALRGKSETLPDDPTLSQLWVAARLGQFDAELSHHCTDHIGELIATLTSVRDRAALLLKVLLFVFVGTVVVALYLPIFRLGTMA